MKPREVLEGASEPRRDAALEEATVRAFLAPARRERWLALLASARRRREVLDALNHGDVLDGRFATAVAPSVDLADLLRRHGAPARCYAISDDPLLDQRSLPVEVALARVSRTNQGTILCCLPGRLGLLIQEGAPRSPTWLLRRADSTAGR